MKTTAALLTAASLFTAACSSAAPVEDATPAAVSGPAKAAPQASWAKKRADEGAARLTAQGEGGALLLEAIHAQGGLERWYTNGPLAFRFTYAPVSGPARDTRQLVDTWSARAVHEVADAPAHRFGWDGQVAWASDEEATKMKPRFWALTPYYFVAIPFVLSDPGVKLVHEGQAELEGRPCELVRATFEAGTGDAPDDFYVVYIDKQTRRVSAVRYVVSYKGFFPDGGHSPEKLMTYDAPQTIDGITFPASFRTFTWVDGAQGELVTNTTMSEVSFKPETLAEAFVPPQGAMIIKEL
jgi:hypothetical protein